MSDAETFITANLRLKPGPAVPEIQLYSGHPASGLGRLGETPPYWAYHWAGGTVLARYVLDHPDSVAGLRVVDLGTGSGLVAIAAVRAGAAQVQAFDIDPYAIAAAELNAAANQVAFTVSCRDILDKPPPEADLILVGDLFYDAETARRVTGFLDRCAEVGTKALVGDPGRAWLPVDRLESLAEYTIPDFATGPAPARVYAWVSAGT
ncbi:MAG TPA: 50S ribosomal protein L11 methyltransferase [Asticcacaulis sp.]|nr:50S ribosomal protein L11 methyltransferase [Asticcacaulis sp.]